MPPGSAPANDPAAAAEEEACRAQIERALERFLVPAPDRDRAEAIVAHGNVIRYLTCRALGVPTGSWRAFGITHTGVTVIQVLPDGTRKVISYNDAGHLPPEL